MKKLFIFAALGLITLSLDTMADNVPVQHDTIQIGEQGSNPFQSDMQQRFKGIFDSFFAHTFDQDPFAENKAFMPIKSIGTISSTSEMYETKDNIVITVDLPGVKKDAIDLQIAPRIVSIKYEQRRGKDSKDENSNVPERRYATFQRDYSLSDYAVTDKADAQYKDGVLTVTIPKDEKAVVKPRKLEIK